MAPEAESQHDGTDVDLTGKPISADEQRVIDKLRKSGGKGSTAAGKALYAARHPNAAKRAGQSS